MALVKGSKKMRVKVVEYRLRNVLLICAALLMLLIVGVGGAYLLGHKLGMAGQVEAKHTIEHLTLELSKAQSDASKFEQMLENVETAAQVDRQSSEDVRQEVIELKDEIARLSEENSFYRGIMSPNDKASGLTLGAVELLRARDSSGSESSNKYSFKVVVQQLATRHSLLKGSLTYTVVGRQAGVETRHPLMALSDEVDQEQIRLRFKYFQVVEGELMLPEGFEPEGIEIEAKTTGKTPQQVFKKFGWLVEEI